MRCPNCGHENVAGTPFCAQCSQYLGEAGQAGQPGQPGQPGPAEGQGAQGWAPPPPGGYPPPDAGGYPPPQQPGSGDAWQQAGQGPYGQPDPGGYPPPVPSGGYPPQSDPGWQQAGGYPASGEAYPPGGYPPAAGYGGPPPGSGGGGRRAALFVVLGVLVVVALVAGGLVLRGTDGGDEEEVVLEPIGSVQRDDFAGNLDAQDVGQGISVALAGSPELEQQQTATLAGQVSSGTEPGLYGGSRDAAVCNVDQLTQFLTAQENSGKAEAWAGVLGIEVADIPGYIDGLTPVRLRFDTRVTNHGFQEGGANGFQSLLQAGTAVLVDAQGVPRVKCNCGNPLLEPQDVEGTSEGDAGSIESVAQNPDDAWEGLEPANVVSVQAGDAVQAFTLVTLEDGQIFARPVGTNGEADADPANVSDVCDAFAESSTCGGSEGNPLQLGGGDVQITLEWNSNADLDLHLVEPDGNEIYYANRGPSASGGQLDKDSNIGCNLNGAVENIFWPQDSPAPPGEYSVEVNGFGVGEASGCGAGDYTLTIRMEGQEDRVETGSVADEETDEYPLTVS